MDSSFIEGITVKKLKVINHPKGDIFHALKMSEEQFSGFGEAYFSTVNFDEVKGWKKHLQMTSNLIVPAGIVKFVVCDLRENSDTKNEFFEIILSPDNYYRLTIKPGLWYAFKGLADNNIVLNIANIEHNPDESENKDLESITYNWG